MGAKNSVKKVLVPTKKKSDYVLLFPRDKDFAVYNKATEEFEKLTGGKKKNLTKEQFLESQAQRFAGMDPQLLDAIWNAFDSDNNGVMDVDEFRLYHAINSVGSRRQRAIALFAVTDTSNDRALQKDEIISLMTLAEKLRERAKMDVPPTELIKLTPEQEAEIAKEAEEFLARHDVDKNGSVELEEFLKGWADKKFADFNFFDDKEAPMVGTGQKKEPQGEKEKQPEAEGAEEKKDKKDKKDKKKKEKK